MILRRGKGEGGNGEFPPREYMEALYPILGAMSVSSSLFWGVRMLRLLVL